MPDDISIQVSGSIGTLSGSIGLKIDPFKPVGNQTPPATRLLVAVRSPTWRRRLQCQLLFGSGITIMVLLLEIPPYEFQWGNFDQSAATAGNKPARKKDIFTDLTKNNSNELKTSRV